MSIVEQSSNNGWQNIGIMRQYARKNIERKNREIFTCLVEESFGYGLRKTLHRSQEYWSKLFGVSKNTFNTQVNELARDGHIKINHQREYVATGGSNAYSYSPVFSKNARIFIKSKKNEPETIIEMEDEQW
jgi:endo-1,4-beta-mannosidase